MIRAITNFILKAGCLWITILVSSTIGAILIGMGQEGVGTDGPLTGGQAFLCVNALHAIILTMIASNARFRGWLLTLLIGATLFFAQSFFLLLEAAYFQDSLKLPMNFLIKSALHVFITAVMVGIVSSLVWRTNSKDAATKETYRNLISRLTLVAVLYVICYFIAGYFIAWAAPEVQAYYSFGENIALIPLLSFQFFRGAMWACLALFLISGMWGKTTKLALIIGATFSVLATAQLLYPSTFMPWEVRLPHLIEVGISNFIFGVLAVLILRAKQLKA